MTVAELCFALSKMPQNALVVMNNNIRGLDEVQEPEMITIYRNERPIRAACGRVGGKHDLAGDGQAELAVWLS